MMSMEQYKVKNNSMSIFYAALSTCSVVLPICHDVVLSTWSVILPICPVVLSTCSVDLPICHVVLSTVLVCRLADLLLCHLVALRNGAYRSALPA